MSFLGLDLGTSGLRALVIDAEGAALASAERGFRTVSPMPGWSEQDPALWLDALDGVMSELRATCPAFTALRGIAVAGHMHGATVLDAAGSVIRPCILWNDTRSAEQAARLDADPDMRAISGNICFPGFTAPKLEWLRENEPDVHAGIAKVLLPAGYVTSHLTGEPVADLSDSAGTGWLDLRARRWSQRLLSAGGMRGDQMPRLVEGCAVAGHLRRDLAQRWGLPDGVIVAGGAGDNAAAACGIGALSEGRGFVSLGTSGVVLVARDGCRPAPDSAVHSFCHAVPDRWYQMGVMLAATDSLNWLSRITGREPAALTAALGERVRPPGRVRFFPYLAGERTPHNDADIRGALINLSTRTDNADLTHAVLEGVCFGLRDSFDALATTGPRPERLFAIGGGARSDYWLDLLATILQIPLIRPDGAEFGAAMGAARLACVAATGARPDEIMAPPATGTVHEPDAELAARFDDAYRGFRARFSALRAIQQPPME